MKTINWSGYEWLTQERWGQYHQDKDFCYYDPEAIEIDSNKELILKTHKNPKKFEDKEISVGVGLVSCVERFGYGYFEIEAKLPKGKNLWPAFWMWAFESWPPEIDVFEGYTGDKGSYLDFNWKDPLKLWKVETNIHLGNQPDNYNLGSKKHWLGFFNPSKTYNRYACLWVEDTIEIYFNNRLIRKITDKKTMSQLRGKTMNVIINNHVDYNINTITPTKSEFKIKQFKYQKL